MFHTITKRLEIYIDINAEISEVDHYTWMFISRIFRLALEINKYFFLQMAFELLSQSRKLDENGGGVLIRVWALENFLKQSKQGGRLLGTREYTKELYQSNYQNVICSNFNNKNTRATSMTSFLCRYC